MWLTYGVSSIQYGRHNYSTQANKQTTLSQSVYRYFLPVEADGFCQNKCSDTLMEDMKIEYHFKIKVPVPEICE